MERGSGRKQETHKCAIVTMGNTTWTRRMALVSFNGNQEIFIEGVIKMMKEMATEKCSGQMVPSIKVNGNKVFSMDKVK